MLSKGDNILKNIFALARSKFIKKDVGVLIAMSLVIAFFFVPIGATAAGLTGDEIVKKAEKFRFPEEPVKFTVTVKDLNGTKVVKESEYVVIAGNDQQSIVETVKPDRSRGRKLLMVDNDLWFFSPDIKRPVRVTLSQKLTGEIANGDLAATQYANDYQAEILGKEKVGERECYKLGLKAKRKGTTYAALHYWVTTNTFEPVKTDYLAKSGKLMKSGYFLKFDSFQGHPRVSQIRIEDALRRKNASVLVYSNRKRIEVSAATFSKESMAR